MDFGVYVHVPFCARRCDYCDFATWTDRVHLVDEYVDACVGDLGRRSEAGHPRATSVFFGGGTPSLLPAAHLTRILDAIPRAPGAEVTVECNPDSVDSEKLATYRAAGATRLSFGVQSMVPRVLAALGRTHDPGSVRRAVDAARAAGFARLSVDLIYGGAGETLDDWRRTLDHALALGVTHVSAYALTVEPDTPLGARVAQGVERPPDDDLQADKYLLADERFAAAGLEWYEISNWAVPGEECRHNLLYWAQGEYLGVGCAAHGHTGNRRWWNVRTPERYVERIGAGLAPEQGSETLAPGPRAEEAFTLALRTRRGAPVAPRARGALADIVAAGLCSPADDRVVLTPTGRLVANDVSARLLLAGAADGGASTAAGQRAASSAAGTRYH